MASLTVPYNYTHMLKRSNPTKEACSWQERSGPLQPVPWHSMGKSRPVGVEEVCGIDVSSGCSGWHSLSPCPVILNESAAGGRGCLLELWGTGEQVEGPLTSTQSRHQWTQREAGDRTSFTTLRDLHLKQNKRFLS